MSNISKVSNYDEIYTFEDLEGYGNRLHINTVTILMTNIFTGYIVFKYSTDAMGKYKNYILLTIISATLMDFHASFIFGIFPLFPLPGFCGAGVISKHLDYFWGEIIPILILHEAFSFCGNSLLISALYRYAVMKGNIKFFHSWYGITIMTIFIILYPTGPALAIILSLDPREESVAFVKEYAPHMYDLYKDGPCNCLKYEKSIAFAILLIIHISIVWFSGVFIVYKTLKLISSVKTSLSINTYRMYQQFIISLAVQLTIPFIFIFVPVVLITLAVILNVQNVKNYVINAVQGLFFHSVINSISILLVIKPYREGVKTCFFKIFCIKPKTIVIIKSTVANTSQNNNLFLQFF